MAQLIQLKQIESSSALVIAAEVGTDFTASVELVVSQSLNTTLSGSIETIVSQSINTTLSASIVTIVSASIDVILPDGVVSGSEQLDGSTFKNIIISTRDADSYSLIISGAMGVVDANNLPQGPNADDTNVPAQIYLAGGTVLPADPSESGSADANVIDQGEF